MASSGGGGDPPRRSSITSMYRNKKTVSTSAPTPTAQQRLATSQYDGPSRSLIAEQAFLHDTARPGASPSDQDSQTIIPETDTDGAAAQVTRIYIEPVGHTFHPHIEPTHKITEIVMANYFGAYPLWTQTPKEVIDLWFREFQRYFEWSPQNHHQIRKNFATAGSKRLRDMLTDVRSAEKKPDWIGESIWEALNREWSTPSFKKKSSQNKKNRASDCGGVGTSLSTCGSVPITEHIRRMLHTRTHQKKGTQQWVDERARIVNDEYMRLKGQAEQLSSVDSSGSPVLGSGPSDLSLWSKAVEGKKKGRTYGLGAQGPAFDAQGLSYTPSDNPGQSTLEQMRQEMAAQQEQMAAQQEQMAAQQEQMAAQLQQQLTEQQTKHQQDMLAQQQAHQAEMTKLLEDIRKHMGQPPQ